MMRFDNTASNTLNVIVVTVEHTKVKIRDVMMPLFILHIGFVVRLLVLYQAGFLLKQPAARRTLVRLLRLRVRVNVLVEVTLLTKALLADRTLVWLFASMNQPMIRQMLV